MLEDNSPQNAVLPTMLDLFPTSFEDNSPQNAVLLIHSRDSVRAKGGLGLALEASISEAEGSGCVEGVVEAETENTVLVLESGNGTLLETLHRNTKDGLVRESSKAEL